MMKFFLLVLVLTPAAWGAFPSTTVGEVRTAGNQKNGGVFDSAGGGTDMSVFDNKNAASCTSCQSDTVNISTTDAVTSTTTVTSATANFSAAINGNGVYLEGTSTTTGWYIATYVSSTTITLDRTVGTGSTGITMNIGGAFKLGGTLDDDFFEAFEAGNIIHIKTGSYSLGETVSIAKAGGGQSPIRMIGYNATRGDNPTGSTRPTLTTNGTSIFTLAANWDINYLIFTGAGSGSLVSLAAANRVSFSKFVNTSTTAGLNAINVAIADAYISDCEIISYRGRGVALPASGTIVNSYIHDSDIGILISGSGSITMISSNIIADNVTAAISTSTAVTAAVFVNGNTLVGSTQTARGTGVNLITGVTDVRLVGNIITGFVTGVTHADAQTIGVDSRNAYYGNTSNSNANWPVSASSTTGVNPTFAGLTYLTGSSATSSTSTLTDGAANFSSVTDGVDFVLLTGGSGTGFPASPTKFLILSHDTTHLTLSSNITSSGGGSGITYIVSQGHNYAIGAGLAGLGAATSFPSGLTPNYLDPGAAQRPGGSAAVTVIY